MGRPVVLGPFHAERSRHQHPAARGVDDAGRSRRTGAEAQVGNARVWQHLPPSGGAGQDGGGEKRTLRTTARFADAWNVWGDVEIMRKKLEVLDGHCADLGRDPGTIRRTAVALVFMTEDQGQLKRLRSATIGRPALIGTAEEIRETLAAYEAIGVDEFIVPDRNLGPPARKIETLDRFIRVAAGH